MKKVYIITKFDMSQCQKEIVSVYSNKLLAKKKVDELNLIANEDSEIFYTLDSFDIIGENDDN